MSDKYLATGTLISPDGRRFPLEAFSIICEGEGLRHTTDSPYLSEFMFEEGNYSCDCNRSLFIQATDPSFPAYECGETIKLVDFKWAEVADN